MTQSAADPQRKSALPRTVWALGLVSFFMDLSSESIHALLPLFLTTTLGASVALVGLIDGMAEATAAVAKVFSGYLSDRWRVRKPFILAGYGLAALSKPLFPLAQSPTFVLVARFSDRVGKGLRGAPRDALLADVTPEGLRGRAYGLRQALDTAGAFAGPLLAIALMALFGDMRLVFWVAAIPAAIAVLCVLFGVEDRAPAAADAARPPIRLRDIAKLRRAYWRVVAIGVVFTLARFSEAFLILKAHGEGLPIALAPLVLIAMNIVYSVGAYPAGALADARPPRLVLGLGVAALIAADFIFAFVPGLLAAFGAILLWGLHMALTQGLLSKLVADCSPAELRSSAFGIFSLATGAAVLLASVLAGLLWQSFGPAATFLAGAAFGSLSLALLARPAI